MYYETNCSCISIKRWKELMRGARRCSYKRLVSRIKKNFLICIEICVWSFITPMRNNVNRQTAITYWCILL